MTTVQDLLAAVDAARDEIVRLHQDLVRIPTLNYGSRPDTGNETPACELIRDKLKEVGIGSDIYESAPTRGNLIARIKGNRGRQAAAPDVPLRRRAGRGRDRSGSTRPSRAPSTVAGSTGAAPTTTRAT